MQVATGNFFRQRFGGAFLDVGRESVEFAFQGLNFRLPQQNVAVAARRLGPERRPPSLRSHSVSAKRFPNQAAHKEEFFTVFLESKEFKSVSALASCCSTASLRGNSRSTSSSILRKSTSSAASSRSCAATMSPSKLGRCRSVEEGLDTAGNGERVRQMAP